MKTASTTTVKVSQRSQRIIRSNWCQRVAQIFNLLYRRIAFGRASVNPNRLESGQVVRIENPRYSRLKICATEPARFWRVVCLVLLAEATAIAAFYGLEWIWLRSLHVAFLQTILPALGCSVEASGDLLTVQGHAFKIDADCTYIDLVLCSLPLLWRVHRRRSANLAVLAGFAAGVAVVNLARVLFGVYALANGVSMFWAHDLVDYVLWYPTLGMVALLWMRSLREFWDAPPPGAPASLPAGSFQTNTPAGMSALPGTVHAP